MKIGHKILLTALATLIFSQSFADSLNHQIEFVSRLAKDLNTTYPYLLNIRGQSIYPSIAKQLSQEITNETELLKIQSKLYEALSSHEDESQCQYWYDIYHKLHMTNLRKSQYAKQKFAELLAPLLSKANVESYDKLLVPAPGQFYEFPEVLDNFTPSLVVTTNIDHSTLEFTRAMFGDNPKLVLKHLHSLETQQDKNSYDAALFIHPRVTNYDKLSTSETYRSHDSEFQIPYTQIKNQSKLDYISKLSVEIILNALSQVKVNGHAFFIFHEHRELDIVVEWLNSFTDFKIVQSIYNDNMIDFAFSKDYLETIGTEQENTAKYAAMGIYRAGLLVQKVK